MKPVFSLELENELVLYCKEMERRFYGLTLKDLRRMTFQLAFRNNLPHPFSSQTKTAGPKWLRCFLKRHPELSVRTPQSLSLARIHGFTQKSVKLFFSILKPQLEKIKFDPTKVYNVDETGITIVQYKARKIVAIKGKKNVHKLSSAERGSLVTVVMCMSASGMFVPPLMIFPRKLMKKELMDGAPPGSIGAVHESGWITAELFEKWFRHFLSIVKPSKDDPIVLILDGHYSHSRNLTVINTARKNGVIIVCLPPHSTAKLQPLDVAFMFPFKTFYAQAIENWLSNNPGRIVGNLQIAQFFNEAYQSAAVIKTAVNGFKKTGILPFNPNIFGQEDCLGQPDPSPSGENFMETDQPSSSGHAQQTAAVISPKDIRKVPVITPSTSKRRGSATLITGSPHRKKVEDSQAKKTRRRRRRSAEKQLLAPINSKGQGKNQPSKKSKHDLPSDSDDESDSSVDTPYDDTSDNDDDNDAMCPICLKRFSDDKHGEQWVQCIECYTWSHETCSGAKNKKIYVCSSCLNA